MQNDSRFILSELSKKEKIQKLHKDSISWYNNLPNNIDLIITHVPPFRNKSNSRNERKNVIRPEKYPFPYAIIRIAAKILIPENRKPSP